MLKATIMQLVAKFISIYGEHELEKCLQEKIEGHPNDTLTVICNIGVHAIPRSVVRGEAYVFSRGHVNLSTAQSINDEMHLLLEKLAEKLKEKNWRKIFIVPSGHPLFYAHAKYMIYRVTRIEATDVVYVGDGRYLDVEISHRPIIAGVGDQNLV